MNELSDRSAEGAGPTDSLAGLTVNSGTVPAILGFILFPLAGICLLYSLEMSPILGSLAGLALGAVAVAAAVSRRGGQKLALRLTSALNFVCLVAVSLAATALIVPSLLINQVPATERPLPLLFAAVLLYAFYLLLGHLTITGQSLKPARRLNLLFSGPSMGISLLMAVTTAAYILLGLHYLKLSQDSWIYYAEKFLERGWIPPLTVLLFCWGLLLLVGKFLMLWREKYMLAEHRADSTLTQLYDLHQREHPDTPVSLWLDMVWKKAGEFYVVPRYINWAIPILGFIGTVLGISLAADGIQQIIGSQQGTEQLSSNLGQAIAPLGIAFDTTLIALSLSLVLTLLQTLLQRWEDGMLLEYENRLQIDRAAP